MSPHHPAYVDANCAEFTRMTSTNPIHKRYWPKPLANGLKPLWNLPPTFVMPAAAGESSPRNLAEGRYHRPKINNVEWAQWLRNSVQGKNLRGLTIVEATQREATHHARSTYAPPTLLSVRQSNILKR